MATFKYRAVSRDGAPVSGVIEAYDEFEAIDRIRESCALVRSIRKVETRAPLLHRDLLSPKISLKQLALLCSQFSIILSAGLPVVRAVELIAAQTADRTLRRLLGQVAEDVAAGYGLAQSFENKGGALLPATFIETLRAGEESGTLEQSFHKLHSYYDKAHKVRAKVRSAMIYPIFLLVLALVVTAFIMGVTMPVFIDMFSDMDIELPALTAALISVTNFFSAWWWAVLGGIVLLALLLRVYGHTEAGRLRFARIQLRLPALGRVARMKGASQFAGTMTALLSAGLPIIRAVAVTARVLDNYHLSLRLGAAVSGLEEGRSLGDCLKGCACFPDMLVEMAAVGEDAGSLEETLETISAYYDSEVAVASERALSMLQPAITVLMGIVIGLLVIGLYLPMFSMYGGIV